MSIKKSLFIALISTGMLTACTPQTEKQEPEAADTMVNALTETHAHEHAESIELDNGKKWKVADHMLAYIRNMESTAKSYRRADPVTDLTDSLKADIDRLTSNCTMEGKAHDELHKWLIPYMDLVDSCASLTTAEALNALKGSFNTFNEYFE